ncbi:MAG: N-acetylmuramoyl-L-alanine amidase [Ruminococcus sp.]|nr:N-acetylmuramoyl-L-alanine amidase [Ruminococcus sp.]
MKKRDRLIMLFGAILCICAAAIFSDEPVAERASLPAVSTAFERQILVIDAGHGGADGGCVSVNGVPEKGINLSILQTMRDAATLLGYDVVCTRESDVSIHDEGVTGLSNQKKSDMDNRLAIINKYEGAVAVSIHQNQFTDPKYSGAQIFYSQKSEDSHALAESIKSRIVSTLQPDNERETKPVGDELFLLNNANCPAVMAECGFLSNESEAARLETPGYQKHMAMTILFGVNDYIRSSGI